MDDQAAETSTSLYERDFHAWTQEQAALLREGNLSAADLPNLLEEIETLGRKERAELLSRLTVLMTHLLKEMYQPETSSRSWKTTILRQRIDIANHISENPSLRSTIAEAFGKAYKDARKLASSETGLPSRRFPSDPPFTYDEAVSESGQPQAVSAPSRGKRIVDRS